MFVVLNFEEIYEYVVWDLLHHTYFCLDVVLLRQGRRGVPIGGVFMCTSNGTLGHFT